MYFFPTKLSTVLLTIMILY
jgi:hypothetical protein